VVGYGFIGAIGHVPAYLKRSDVEIVAVADPSPARRALVPTVLEGTRVYDAAQALLDAEAGHLDFLDIATPPSEHAAIAHLALDAGLHVLCEKPLTTRLSDAAALLEHARRAGRVLFPVHNYKHAPVVVAIRDVIASGRIGAVQSVTLETFRNTHAKGVPEWNTNWRRQARWSGGGIAMDHGSHTFYLTFDLLGAWPVAVTAKMANLEPTRWDTEDSFSAVLTFPGGRLAHVHLSWTAGERRIIYTIQGERGALVVDDDDMQIATMRATAGPDVAQGAEAWDVDRRSIPSDWTDASHTGWFNAMFDQFRDAVARDDFAGKEVQDAYRCIEIITTAYRSAADGCLALPLAGPPEGF
jgi:predicted dehydrogenase